MASIVRHQVLDLPAAALWALLRDIGQEARLFPGVLIASRREGDDRIVTFADGRELRERIVTIDDADRRLVYAAQGPGIEHHSAAWQVLPAGQGCRLVWTTDVLPHALADAIAPVMAQGLAALRRAVTPPG